jgi:hypothetical protein
MAVAGLSSLQDGAVLCMMMDVEGPGAVQVIHGSCQRMVQ